MRLFTGIAVPHDAAQPLLNVMRELRQRGDLNWTREEKLHVTTRFIGDFPEDRLPELRATLETVTAPGPIEIRMARLGWLPNPRFPTALYAGVERTVELNALANATEAALEPLGIAKEDRIYRPHVTLARVRKRDKTNLAAIRDAVSKLELADFGTFPAAGFHLYLSDNGKYTKLIDFALPSA